MNGIQHRSLMPVVRNVRDTGPPTPRKVSVEPRQGVRGRTKSANRAMNEHEEREIQAAYAKWYLDQPVPLPRKVIAARVGLSLDVVNNIEWAAPVGDDFDADTSYPLHSNGAASTLPAEAVDDVIARLHAVVKEVTGREVVLPVKPRIGFLP